MRTFGDEYDILMIYLKSFLAVKSDNNICCFLYKFDFDIYF